MPFLPKWLSPQRLTCFAATSLCTCYRVSAPKLAPYLSTTQILPGCHLQSPVQGSYIKSKSSGRESFILSGKNPLQEHRRDPREEEMLISHMACSCGTGKWMGTSPSKGAAKGVCQLYPDLVHGKESGVRDVGFQSATALTFPSDLGHSIPTSLPVKQDKHDLSHPHLLYSPAVEMEHRGHICGLSPPSNHG